MSWDLELRDTTPDVRQVVVHEVNYTHNVNPMIRRAAGAVGVSTDWWHCLDGIHGAEGAAWLSAVISELEAHPDRYRMMDPPNNWGSYDTLLPVLRGARDAVPADRPTMWRVSG